MAKIGSSIKKISKNPRMNIKNIVKSSFKRAIFLSYFVLMGAFIAFHLYYPDKVLPNTFVNDINVSGMSAGELAQTLETLLPEDIEVKFKIDEKSFIIKDEDIGFKYLPVATAKKVFDKGRSGNFVLDLKTKLLSFWDKDKMLPEYEYDEFSLKYYISKANEESLDNVVEPTFKLNDDSSITVVPGTDGQTIDVSYLEHAVLNHFIRGQIDEIAVVSEISKPKFELRDMVEIQPEVSKRLGRNYELNFGDKKWVLSDTDIVAFLTPEKNNGSIRLALNKENVLAKLTEISEEINQNPRGQILEVKDGRAVEFFQPEEGRRLKVKESFETIEKSLLSDISPIVLNKEGKVDPTLIALDVEITQPPESPNEYEIVESIGEGSSLFKGSIPGRVNNIENAAKKLDGVLVAPGEVFSFLDSVGPIDRSNGFGPAYVISGGRTVLGDGGGVCQVSTTLFRAILNSGLQMVERSAHSYRVGYYEQDVGPGLDATVYSPTVDLKFRNDTENYILIDSDFDRANSSLKFTFYGKKDGRTVEVTEPKILKQTPPPATVYIEDPNQPKGYKRREESAVWGANVVLTRKVEKDGKVLYDDTFKSNYRAWAAVYTIGTRE